DRLHHRGNVRIHHSADEAREAVAEAVRLDIAAGRSMAVTVATNDQAAALNADIQAQRIAAGHLKTDDHSTTGRDGLDIFAGDSDGGLARAGQAQRHRLITPPLLAEHIHLGAGVTDYGNQGTPVDQGAVLLDPAMSGGGVYVRATPGREDNTIHSVADDLEGA